MKNIHLMLWSIKNHQSKGFGRELIEFALSQYEDYKDVYGKDLALKLDVVNPIMRSLLTKHYAFKDIEKVAGYDDRYIMTLKK